MGKIKILSDQDGVYEVGSVVDVMDFIRDWMDCSTDKSINDWVSGIPIPSAVKFIADALGIEYEYV